MIGGRYLTFDLLYGLRLYWAVGLTLAAAGCVLGMAAVAPAWAGFSGAGIEAIFAIVVLVSGLREARTNTMGGSQDETKR